MADDSKLALVTGANGFVGTYVVRTLLARHMRVRALVRRKGERDELRADGVEEVAGDFVDAGTAQRAMEGVHFVVHCAATVGPDRETARSVNVDGTRSIFEAIRAADHPPRAVHISSVSVYDSRDREDEIDEDDALLPAGAGNVYGATKAEGDGVVLDAIEAGARATILRPAAILGVHPSSSWAVRVPERIRSREMKLSGDGSGRLPIVHIDDVCRAITLSLESDVALGRVYNVVDEHVTWKTFTDDVRAWFGTEELETVPRGEGGAGDGRATFSGKRIRKELGYGPLKSYAVGMEEARRWWEERARTT